MCYLGFIVINTIITSHFEKGRFYLILHCQSQSIIERGQCRNSSRTLETGCGIETIEECCLLPCSQCLAQPTSLYKPWLPIHGWHCLQCAGPQTLVTNQGNATTGLCNSHLIEAFSHSRWPWFVSSRQENLTRTSLFFFKLVLSEYFIQAIGKVTKTVTYFEV